MIRFRHWLADKLARLARRLHPLSNEVRSFYGDRMMEAAITGTSFIKISAVDQEEILAMPFEPKGWAPWRPEDES